MKRTCDQLGLCQNKTPRCSGCSAPHFFAPGAIDHERTRINRRQLARTWGLRIMALMAVVALVASIGFCAGYLVGLLK